MKRTGIASAAIFILVIAGLTAGVPMPARATGPAFTGITAKADTAETVFLNPAGMSRLKRPSWYGNPMVMFTESNSEFTVEGREGKQKVEDDGVIFLPGIYYVHPLNDRWSVGIGPNVASGLGTSYGDQWAGRYILDEWSLYFVGIAPSVAYRVNDNLSLGVSLSVNYSRFNLEKAVYNLDPNATDGHFELEADGWAVGANLGLLYEFTAHTRMGIVYRSELEATNEGNPKFSNLTPQRRALLEEAGILNQEISVDTNRPQSLQAGLFHDFGNGWTLTVDGLWFDFSNWNIDNVEIGDTTIDPQSTDYQDIWALSVGGTYAWHPKWTLRGGVLYVSSGVEDEDRTLFTRYDDIWAFGAGVKYSFNAKRSLAVDITYFIFGDGEFEVNDTIAGDIAGEYDEHYGLSFSISTTW